MEMQEHYDEFFEVIHIILEVFSWSVAPSQTINTSFQKFLRENHWHKDSGAI